MISMIFVAYLNATVIAFPLLALVLFFDVAGRMIALGIALNSSPATYNGAIPLSVCSAVKRTINSVVLT
jgi:hypothetical protein